MNLAALIVGPIVALAGVWLGGWITSRGQERLRDREERRHERDELRVACRAYLAAARQFDQYLKDPRTVIDTVANPGAPHPIPIFDARAEPYNQTLEACSASLLFAAASVETINQATRLRTALVRLAVARAEHPGPGRIPNEPVLAVLAAERDFMNAARRDLGLAPMEAMLRTMSPVSVLEQA